MKRKIQKEFLYVNFKITDTLKKPSKISKKKNKIKNQKKNLIKKINKQPNFSIS